MALGLDAWTSSCCCVRGRPVSQRCMRGTGALIRFAPSRSSPRSASSTPSAIILRAERVTAKLTGWLFAVGLSAGGLRTISQRRRCAATSLDPGMYCSMCCCCRSHPMSVSNPGWIVSLFGPAPPPHPRSHPSAHRPLDAIPSLFSRVALSPTRSGGHYGTVNVAHTSSVLLKAISAVGR
ncbi:hypothetical protein FKP32DRAFT_1757873, partial [Trametes sanguinea]